MCVKCSGGSKWYIFNYDEWILSDCRKQIYFFEEKTEICPKRA